MIEFLENYGTWILLIGSLWLLSVAFWPREDEDESVPETVATAWSQDRPAAAIASSPDATIDQSQRAR